MRYFHLILQKHRQGKQYENLPPPPKKILPALILAAFLPVQAAEVAGKYDLGTLKSNNSGNSYVDAISADGSLAAGTANNDNGEFHAIIWRGKDYGDKLDLGTLKSDNSGESRANALSADGSLAAGWAYSDKGGIRAIIWRGQDYGDKLDLGTLRSDNWGWAWVNALSADGLVAAGRADNYSGTLRATVWHGKDYGDKLDLGTLKSDNSGESRANALSADGSLAAGQAYNDRGEYRATVWRGRDYGEKLDLGTLKSDNSGESQANALSADGSLAAGQATNDNGESRATVWRGKNYGDRLDLGTLKSDNSGNSGVSALSADGSVAAGWADNDSGHNRAVVWHGQDYGDKLDLGTLKSDNSGKSWVNALSADGSIAAGQAYNDRGEYRATVWRISGLGAGGRIDAEHTRAALARMGRDGLAVAALQYHALARLRDRCLPQNGRACVQLRSGYAADGSRRDADTALSAAYRVSPSFAAGASLARSTARSLPDSYRRTSGNFGGSLFAQWQPAGGAWFVRPSLALNRYAVRPVRELLDNTEPASGRSHVKGLGAELAFGSDGNIWGWEAGIRHSRIKRAAYSEDYAVFPASYGDMRFHDTAAFAAAKAAYPLNARFSLTAEAAVERSLHTRKPEFTAELPYVGSFRYRPDYARTRGTFAAGLRYHPAPATALSLTPYVGKSLSKDTLRGIDFRLSHSF